MRTGGAEGLRGWNERPLENIEAASDANSQCRDGAVMSPRPAWASRLNGSYLDRGQGLFLALGIVLQNAGGRRLEVRPTVGLPEHGGGRWLEGRPSSAIYFGNTAEAPRLALRACVALHTWRSGKQLRSAPGFLGGYLASGKNLSLWTITMWADEAPMRAFRAAAPHVKAMPKLLDTCDEAAVVHWTSPTVTLPTVAEAAERMLDGRTSKVRHPSEAHAAGRTWPDGKVPLRGPALPI